MTDPESVPITPGPSTGQTTGTRRYTIGWASDYFYRPCIVLLDLYDLTAIALEEVSPESAATGGQTLWSRQGPERIAEFVEVDGCVYDIEHDDDYDDEAETTGEEDYELAIGSITCDTVETLRGSHDSYYVDLEGEFQPELLSARWEDRVVVGYTYDGRFMECEGGMYDGKATSITDSWLIGVKGHVKIDLDQLADAYQAEITRRNLALEAAESVDGTDGRIDTGGAAEDDRDEDDYEDEEDERESAEQFVIDYLTKLAGWEGPGVLPAYAEDC